MLNLEEPAAVRRDEAGTEPRLASIAAIRTTEPMDGAATKPGRSRDGVGTLPVDTGTNYVDRRSIAAFGGDQVMSSIGTGVKQSTPRTNVPTPTRVRLASSESSSIGVAGPA